MISKPTLEGPRVRCRPLASTDLEGYVELLEDKELLRLTGSHRRFSRVELAEWLATTPQKEGRVDLAVISKSSGELLGEVVLNEIDDDNRCGNLRIGLRSSFFGQGYGPEAMRLVIVYGFEVLGLHRIELEVFAFNDRAIRAYEKLGFRREGVRREALFQDGRYHNAITMALLDRELDEAAETVRW